MRFYEAPFYTEEQLMELDEKQIKFPFSDKDAVYIGKDHQYELTSAYFQERGVNLEKLLDGNEPDRVANFLRYLRLKFYTRIYNTNKSTRQQLNFMIAKKGLLGYTMYEYRQAFLEAMFLEGEYLAYNGDISQVSGVDLDNMQSIDIRTTREEDRDFSKDSIELLKTLGLRYFGKYRFIPQGNDW